MFALYTFYVNGRAETSRSGSARGFARSLENSPITPYCYGSCLRIGWPGAGQAFVASHGLKAGPSRREEMTLVGVSNSSSI